MLVASLSSSLLGDLRSLPGPLVYTVLAALVFAETALFIGFVFPGETAVIVAGATASTGHVNIILVCAVVVVAAAGGNSVGYLIGDHFGIRLLDLRLLRKRRPTFERALDSIENRGVVYVFVGRFTAILRAIMPALAGMSEMSWRRFQIANVLSALVWGIAFSLLGYYAGHELSRVEGDATWVAAAVLAGVVVALVVRHFISRHREHQRADAWRAEHGDAKG